MYLQKVISRKLVFIGILKVNAKNSRIRIDIQIWIRIRGMDPRIQIRIWLHTKMSWICNTAMQQSPAVHYKSKATAAHYCIIYVENMTFLFSHP